MTVKIDNETLLYLHAELNRQFFDGSLEPAIIKMCAGVDEFDLEDGITATTFTEQIPFSIVFWYDVSDDDPMYIATMLLHEMIHQYCRENDIDDDRHNDNFIAVASDHGLCQSGYKLKDDAKEIIEESIRHYNIIREVTEKDVANTVAKYAE